MHSLWVCFLGKHWVVGVKRVRGPKDANFQCKISKPCRFSIAMVIYLLLMHCLFENCQENISQKLHS